MTFRLLNKCKEMVWKRLDLLSLLKWLKAFAKVTTTLWNKGMFLFVCFSGPMNPMEHTETTNQNCFFCICLVRLKLKQTTQEIQSRMDNSESEFCSG